ncbi:UNVERIFIED_CONTAM: hypothetical protein Scaly_0599600 [Sesamum calycinum]|uniref:DUF4218 domain-containing protein n=1 Tax=Sesamum calycinum TaxID=2727403 RepID=A0AAW2RSW8_9LAMI
MPKAVYTLTKDQKRKKLIPVAFREMVPEHVWSALTEVSLMFQVLCSTTLDIRKVQELEDSVAVIITLSLAFFDSMEHLILHLPYEARVGGPVQYRWMYPFERFLRELKKKVKNKAHVEASIVEAYIVEEIGWFTFHYFEPHVTCKRRRPSRNDDLTREHERISRDIFNHPPSKWCFEEKICTGQERHMMETYVLCNSEVAAPYYESFLNELYKTYSPDDPLIDQLVESELQNIEDDLLRSLYWGPKQLVKTWPCYFVNGFNFHTEDHNVGKSTMNCGIDEEVPVPEVNTNNQTYDLHDPDGLQFIIDLTSAMQHEVGTSRLDEDDEDSFDDYETNEESEEQDNNSQPPAAAAAPTAGLPYPQPHRLRSPQPQPKPEPPLPLPKSDPSLAVAKAAAHRCRPSPSTASRRCRSRPNTLLVHLFPLFLVKCLLNIETALPTPPVAPAADEPPQSPLIDPTPLDPSSVPPGTSTVGGSFAPSSIPSSVSQAPTAPRETRKFITLAEARDFGPLHAAMEKLQTDPPILEELLKPGWRVHNPIGWGDGIWHDLQAYWNSDEFKAKSAKNKVNRVANPVAASTVYRGGSSSVGMHKRKLEAQLGRPPNRMEVFADCYKKKADGTWSGKRAEEVVPASGEVGSSNGTSLIVQEDQLWAEVAGGRERGRVFGMGSDALMSDAAQPWTTEARSSSSTTAPLPTDTKLDKIMLVLSALCTKMGMPQIFFEMQSTGDAPIDGTTQQATENATDEPEA